MTVHDATTPLKGRGAVISPPNRFERLVHEPDPEAERSPGAPPTEYLRDPARQIIASNDSPDVGFDRSINPYRGCEHGCAYCYARPTHEYLGFSAGLDFETRIMVKEDAAALLRKELAARSWTPQVIALSGVTDPYQPIEKKLGITRGCLEVLAECRNPVVVVTKNQLVTRDADLLGELARFDAVRVFLSITTLDPALANRLEPRASSPRLRLEAVRELRARGVPAGVMVAPVIPAITDHEIPKILEAAAGAGAEWAGWVMLRLPGAVAPMFEAWVEAHFPDRKEKVLSRIRSIRDGAMYDTRWGVRQRGQGPFADQVRAMFETSCRRFGLNRRKLELSTEHFRRPRSDQGELFR
ncbi:MAG TPA: PA0069 family radical SAM protein [Thermoanaerobaculia bacterium]|nr:PA0069 family radical SAM protein [Thermoanaerobaculia bacterium]